MSAISFSEKDHKGIQIQSLSYKIDQGIKFLNQKCEANTGFQSHCFGPSRSNLTKEISEHEEHPQEIFTSLMALDLLSTCLSKNTLECLYAVIRPINLFTTNDVDSTSIIHFILQRDGLIDKESMENVVQKIISNTDQDDVIQLYLPPRGDQEDMINAVAISNALSLIYVARHAAKAKMSEDYMFHWLKSGYYLQETGTYASSDAFLYFLSRFVSYNQEAKERFAALIVKHIKKRVESSIYPLDIMLRILALGNLEMLGEANIRKLIGKEVVKLLSLQQQDGSFPQDVLCKRGLSESYIGGTVMSTIFGVAAMRSYLESLLKFVDL